eukprot:TRINITY_DN8299_c0_g1_i4.p1 TRINITY_DN8299_c0_g1~~TRINITY_DN8299_c0_g1_i4.p1  ORF type:complete len:186 (+),score=49.15 TRINITY_DN8299_c0_g1_i4:56-559(+)
MIDEDLWVTHATLRDGVQQKMIEFVRNGGFFTAENIVSKDGPPKLITIATFPDNKSYVWDGHHRVCAIYLGGRNYISKDELRPIRLTYQLTMTPNLDTGFVTPFDPRTEVRVRDFLPFKKKILEMRERKEKTDQQLIAIIYHNRPKHIHERKVFSISDMIQNTLSKL